MHDILREQKRKVLSFDIGKISYNVKSVLTEPTYEKPSVASCIPTFPTGKLKVLYIQTNDLMACSQVTGGLGDLKFLLKNKGLKLRPASIGGITVIVARLLGPYLHQRKNIPIIYSPHIGKKFNYLKTEFNIESQRRTNALKAILISTGVSFGNLTYIEGTYKREGVIFSGLVRKIGSKQQYNFLSLDIFEE